MSYLGYLVELWIFSLISLVKKYHKTTILVRSVENNFFLFIFQGTTTNYLDEEYYLKKPAI